MDELQRFEQLVLRRAGLSLREQERTLLRKLLSSRLQVLGLGKLETYCDLLQSGSAAGEAEWTQMFALLTNNETYFFRDSGQLALLRDHILPEIIAKNRSHRTLRVWSAGCSTGEEPYSLAIILDELLGLEKDWKVLILGTDLSEAALDKARAGVYGSWSFRAMNAAIQERYFSSRSRNADKTGGKSFVLNGRIRDAVVFKQNNLWLDAFPSPASLLHDIDLIVCRNVFIYFQREAVSAVLAKFSRTLRPGGYLLTGHAELHNTTLHGLQARTFPQTVIYQTPEVARTLSPNTAVSNTSLPSNLPPRRATPTLLFAPVKSATTVTMPAPLPPKPPVPMSSAPVLPVPVATAPAEDATEARLREAEACLEIGQSAAKPDAST